MSSTDYRARIYGHYVRGLAELSRIETVADLGPSAPFLRRLIRTHFPADRGVAILDLGCGHGTLLHFAREAGYSNLVGVDASPEQVACAAHLGIEGVREADLLATLRTLPHGSQDAVVSFDVIEHFTKSELMPFVDEVHRVLKPHGRWIVHIPNAQSPFFGVMRYGDFTHELACTASSIRQLLLASGFGAVAYYEDRPVPHGLKSAARWVLWKLIRGVLRCYLAVETGETGRNAIFSQNFLAVAVK